MNREQQEMTVWRCEYELRRGEGLDIVEAAGNADAAAAEFRKRYPAEPIAPDAVWYDEPPFAKDGNASPVWLVDYPYPLLVAYFNDGWAYEVPGRSNRWLPLAGRPVSPIHKPQEPTT